MREGRGKGEGGKKCKEKSGKMGHMPPPIPCPLTYHQGWSNHFHGEVCKHCLQRGLLFRLAQASPQSLHAPLQELQSNNN